MIKLKGASEAVSKKLKNKKPKEKQKEAENGKP